MKTRKVDCGCEKGVFACRAHTHPQHTLAPWSISELKTSINGTDFDGRGIRILDIPDHEAECQQVDAAFAVRAVNSHEELVKMLEDCREFILRFDESDDAEIEMSKRISELLEKSEGK